MVIPLAQRLTDRDVFSRPPRDSALWRQQIFHPCSCTAATFLLTTLRGIRRRLPIIWVFAVFRYFTAVPRKVLWLVTQQTKTMYNGSEANLKIFLLDYAEHSGLRDIYLISPTGWSDGALISAMCFLFAEYSELKGWFKGVIFTASYIDANILKNYIVLMVNHRLRQRLFSIATRSCSLRKIYGYSHADKTVILSGVEEFDASGLDTSFLEHSYFATN